MIAEIKRNNRSSILNYLEKQGVIISSVSVKNQIVNDNEGDALDGVIAAYATFKALINSKFQTLIEQKKLISWKGMYTFDF